MTMARRTLLGAAALRVPGIARGQAPAPPDEYMPCSFERTAPRGTSSSASQRNAR
jgi:hypothetical protein